MANFTAWAEKSPRSGNYLVRYRDGKTKLPNGRWKVFTELTVDRTHRLMVDGKWETAKTIAEDIARKLELQNLNNLRGNCDLSKPIGSLLEKFIADCQSSGIGWMTYERYDWTLQRIFPEAKIETLSDLTDEKVRAWRESKLGKQKTSTIHRGISTIITFARWLKRKKHIEHIPFQEKLRPTLKRNTPRYYPTEEWERLDLALATLNHHARLACNLAYYAGLRKIELVGDGRERPGVMYEDLTWNLDETVDLFLRAEVVKGGETSRVVRLSPEIVALLGSRRTGPLIPLERDEFYRIFKKARKAAKIKPNLTVHGQRHSFAKNYLEEGGMDLSSLKDMMGHLDIATTQIYSAHEKSHLAKGIAKAYERRQEQRAVKRAGQLQGNSTEIEVLNVAKYDQTVSQSSNGTT